MKKTAMLVLLILGSKMSFGQWSSNPAGTLIYTPYWGTYVTMGAYADDIGGDLSNNVTIGGNLGLYDGAINFRDYDNPKNRSIFGNSLDYSMYLYQNNTLKNGPAIALYSNTETNVNDDARAMNFFVPGCGNSGGRTAFAFSVNPADGCTDPNKDIFILTREGEGVFAGGIKAGGGVTAASAKFTNLATGTGKMVVANQYGELTPWELPYMVLSGNSLALRTQGVNYSTVTLPIGGDNLSISGSTLSLKNGTTTLSSVTLPSSSGADNLGNHTATSDLKMTNHNITGINSLSIGGVLISPTGSGGQLYIGGAGGLTISTGDFNVNGFSTFARSITVAGTVYPSDNRLKKNVNGLSDIRNRLFQVTPRQYNYIPGASKTFQFDDKVHYGFIAQDVEKVFPELTKQVDEEGHIGVNYIEFIPMLLQVVKEDAQKIADLESRLEKSESQIAQLTERLNTLDGSQHTASDATNRASGAVSGKTELGQNVPNPFSGETVIPYTISKPFTNAFIGVYDLNGKEILKLKLDTGKHEISLSAANLESGMYVYNLVVDGTLEDAKRMVITK